MEYKNMGLPNISGNIKAYNCDCMDLLKQTPDNYYELSIVDPPYGIGFSDYERGSSGIKTKERHTKNGKKKWDENTPKAEYFKELKRVSKNQIVFGGNYFIELSKIETTNLKTIKQFNEYILKSSENWFFWYKQNPVPNFADGELAWLSFNKNSQYDYRYYGNLEGNTSASKKYHPTQKPVKLYEWLLMNYAKEGDKILDTHRGSASLDIACHNLGFDLVTCEIDTDYFNDGNKRLKQHQNQLKMF